mmetsp:Transcript_26177/g.76354  ORF Transcript_26177/g.76354 Transcript_26177/m.76354 type:complete len:134 (-) Transcript_26177:160-561(-)
MIHYDLLAFLGRFDVRWDFSELRSSNAERGREHASQFHAPLVLIKVQWVQVQASEVGASGVDLFSAQGARLRVPVLRRIVRARSFPAEALPEDGAGTFPSASERPPLPWHGSVARGADNPGSGSRTGEPGLPM